MAAQPPKPIKVLVADDDPTSLKLVTSTLAPYGRCDTAADGRETLLSFQQALKDNEPYDALLLDIMMPQFDGGEVLRRIRAYESKQQDPQKKGLHTSIIMVTGLTDMANIIKAVGDGCDAYITKPLSKERLLEELTKLCVIKQLPA